MNPDYVKILSWHIVSTPTRAMNRYRTLCGRNAWGPTFPSLPEGKSCETCFRVLSRKLDS